MLINLSEYRSKKEAEQNATFTEIDYDNKYNRIMSVSIWEAEVIREMLLHSARNRSEQVLDAYVDELLKGKVLEFINGNITSIYRLATPEDEALAVEDKKNWEQEMNDFLESENYDASFEKHLLDKLCLPHKP